MGWEKNEYGVQNRNWNSEDTGSKLVYFRQAFPEKLWFASGVSGSDAGYIPCKW